MTARWLSGGRTGGAGWTTHAVRIRQRRHSAPDEFVRLGAHDFADPSPPEDTVAVAAPESDLGAAAVVPPSHVCARSADPPLA
jgi:hypothetical protein